MRRCLPSRFSVSVRRLQRWFCSGPLSRLPRGALARSTVQVLAWNLARLFTQLLWIILMTRSLGAEGYGMFSGASGLALALSGLAGVGLGLRMYQDAARTPEIFGLRWAQARKALWWSCIALALLFTCFGLVGFVQLSPRLIATIAISELVFAPMVTQVAFAYAAHGQMARAAAAPVLLSCGRVAAAAVFALTSQPDVVTYGLLHLLGTGGSSCLVWYGCYRRLSFGRHRSSITWSDLRIGLGFSSIWASGLALGSLDKAAALHYGGAEIAGHYTAAHRFVSIATQPIEALVMTAMPRLFRAGNEQTISSHLLVALFAATAGYGCFAAVIVWLAAPLLPWVLGETFAATAPVLHVLALYIPIYGLRTLGSNVLLGFDKKHWRFNCEISGLMLNIVLIGTITPRYGSVGAAISLIASETVLLAMILAGLVKHLSITKNSK